LIFTLFGDYILERGGEIWTRNLLELMGLLDVSERATRSTLSRMTKKGWIVPEKRGRCSRYSLTERGRALLKRGKHRIFEPAFKDWDGQWHLVIYSLPESHRSDRHTLRTQLSWLGFGRLAPGTCISPHDRSVELESLVSDLGIEPFVDLFCGSYWGPSVAQDLIHRCWDLAAIEDQYRGFVGHYQKEYQDYISQDTGNPYLTPEAHFIRRFWLTYSFQSFPLKDPNLPSVLLPEDWIGITARSLFDNYHRLLGSNANQFVDDVLSGAFEIVIPPDN
jgi:phenylacetic acid degradation operon negative regulatory protein